MKALKLSGENGIKIARCLIGSPAVYDREIFPVQYDKCGTLWCITPDNEFICGGEYFDEIILPIDTLVFDPFAAMREGVNVVAKYYGQLNICSVSKLTYDGEFADSVVSGDWLLVKDSISLDVEAACRLDGVEVVDEIEVEVEDA